MGRYEFIPGVAIADLAFEVEAETLEELFTLSARALFEAMVELKDVRPVEEVKISLSAEKLDNLLFDYLAELVYQKDLEARVFSEFEVSISENGNFKLEGKAKGEKIDPAKQELKTDVKAITYHLFKLEKRDKGYYARVVLDT
ncbi:MAG: archease [candidate division Zixibacteria bacterium]|nr:archease [candidate division Zixibacteria bacterium]